MKKSTFLLLIAMVGFGLSVKAQIQRGNVMVGGNFANINLGLNDPKVFSFDITPKAAWFVADNVAFGGYVNFQIQTAKGSSTTVTYGIGPLARYYAGSDMTVLRHGRFFGEANIGIGGVNVSDGGGHTNGLDFGVGPGFAYFVTPSVGLETLLKYNADAGFGNAGYSSNLNLFFGLQVYLPGRATAAKIRRDAK